MLVQYYIHRSITVSFLLLNNLKQWSKKNLLLPLLSNSKIDLFIFIWINFIDTESQHTIKLIIAKLI
jgi:hypothetical protein